MTGGPGDRSRRPGGTRPSARRGTSVGGRTVQRSRDTRPDRSHHDHDPVRDGTGERPLTLRVAAALTGLEALASLAWGVVLAVGLLHARDAAPRGAVGALVGFFVVLALVAAVAAAGLWRNRRRPVALAAVLHGIVALVGADSLRSSWPVGLAFVAVGGGGLAALFARATRRSLGDGTLPGR